MSNYKYTKNNIVFNFSLIIILISSLLLMNVIAGCKSELGESDDELIISSNEKDEVSLENEEDTSENFNEESAGETEVEKFDEYELVNKRIEEFINALDMGEKEFIELNYEDKQYLIDIAHKAIGDYFSGTIQADESLFLEKYAGMVNEVFIIFRIGGKKKGNGSEKNDNLAESVYFASLNTIEDIVYNENIAEKDTWDLKIEILIPGDEKLLDENYEKGIHGLRLVKAGKSTTYTNTIALEGNFDLNEISRRLCLENALPEDCADDNGINIYYFPTIHFASTAFSDEITSFFRCNIIEKKPGFDLEKINNTLDMAEGWMLLNLDEDGFFNYEYYPWSGKYSTSNNMIRQLMSSRWLAEVSSKNDALSKMHKVNLDYVLKNWYRENGELGYIYFDDKSKIGATAMALRTIVYSPYLEDYKDEAEKLANNILSLQNEDGSFNAWYIEPDYSYDEERLLRFYSGETILALIDFFEATGEDKYLDAAIKSQDFYISDYIDNMEEDEDYYPAFIPWHAQTLNRLFKITGDNKYSDAIFKITDKILKMQNQDGKPYIDFLGRFYNPNTPQYGSPHSASTSVYLEGVAYAYEVAEMVEDFERMFEYKKSIMLGTHNLMNLQFKGADMYYMEYPQRVSGAIRVSVDEHRIRIDTTGHTIDAFRKIIEVFELD